MKKVAIITIFDMGNYGNRLQNYATEEYLKKYNLKVETVINLKEDFNLKYYIKHIIKLIIKKRYYNFYKFNKNIKFSKTKVNYTNISKKIDNYNYYIVGSDQVWNPNFSRLNALDLLKFTDSNNKIAFSASFGITTLPIEYKDEVKEELKKFKRVSVREEQGKRIIEELTGRKDVEVLVDPTMLLTSSEWDKVSKKPSMLNSQKYILNYFLGDLSEVRKKEIERIAKENDCAIINILDKKSPFYNIGPSEFLYLEKNAFLICTDSFHSSVFSIIYNTPFIVFERVDKEEKINSRIDTLLNKFELNDRKYNGKITKELLKCDYTKAYKILEQERNKSKEFLKNALDIK